MSAFAFHVDREAATFGHIQVIYFSQPMACLKAAEAALPTSQQCSVGTWGAYVEVGACW